MRGCEALATGTTVGVCGLISPFGIEGVASVGIVGADGCNGEVGGRGDAGG